MLTQEFIFFIISTSISIGVFLFSFAWAVKRGVKQFTDQQNRIAETLAVIQSECVKNSKIYLTEIGKSHKAFIKHLKTAK